MKTLKDYPYFKDKLLVGYWKCKEDSTLPHPSEFIDHTWDPTQRIKVLQWLDKGINTGAYHGYSWCRFKCGVPDRAMGSCDLSDGVWTWPEGYFHYILHHGVKPPPEFVTHVLAQSEVKGNT